MTFTRNEIGLEIKVQVNWASEPVRYVDATFDVSRSQIALAVSTMRRIDSRTSRALAQGQEAVILIPEKNPDTSRVTKRSLATFNTGELLRLHCLRTSPECIEDILRDYQNVGATWLANTSRCILADDMGIGKTVQTIAATRRLFLEQHLRNALVVCPKTLVGNWESELIRWAPELPRTVIAERISPSSWPQIARKSCIAIVNYESFDPSNLDGSEFDIVIADEIHRLRNPATNSFKNLSRLNPKHLWGLTGTPIENSVRDALGLLQLLEPTRFSAGATHWTNSALRATLKRYMLRRTKAAIASELGNITEIIEPVRLTRQQETSYRRILTSQDDWISIFSRLRDICDIDESSGSSAKLDRCVELVNAISLRKEKCVIFSYRIEPLRHLEQRLRSKFGSQFSKMLTGEADPQSRTRLVHDFQTKPKPAALLCSIKAAAEGITLTRANNVIFINEWWNPSLNAQARDRVFRIGQEKDVTIIKLRASNTVEDRLSEILSEKQELFRDVIEGAGIIERTRRIQLIIEDERSKKGQI